MRVKLWIRRFFIAIAACALIEAAAHWSDFSLARVLAMMMIYYTVRLLSDIQRNPDYGLQNENNVLK